MEGGRVGDASGVRGAADPALARKDLLERYGVALALAALALSLRGVLPFEEGTSVFQLPLAAVLIGAWYGGRGPGLLASAICIVGAWYLFLPPVMSWQIAPGHVLPLWIFAGLCLLVTLFAGGRRSTEQALRASEQRFHALVQFSFDVYWETDAQHRFTRQEFSDRLVDAPARGFEIGKTRWEIPYVEPDEDGWRQHRATLDAHLPFRDFELARPMPDGGRRYVSVSGIPAFDEAGRFLGYRGVGRHITERKLAEAERRAHVWFLESMDRVNRAMQGAHDIERMMSDVLEAMLEIFGSDRAWMLYPCDPDAPSWRVVMEHARPQHPGAGSGQRDLPMTADAAEVARAALDSRGALAEGPGHERQVKPEVAERFGVRSQMLLALRPNADRPYLLGMHQCSRDRTWTTEEQRLFEEIGHRLADALNMLIAFRGLRESERRLEAAQRLAHVGWWERDYVTGRVSLSDEAGRIFGVEPVDLPEWDGRWRSLIHPEDRDRMVAANQKALEGVARYDVEYRVVRPDGAVRVVHSQGDVIRDESGRAVRQFGVMQDITDLRRAEQDVRSRQDMLDLAQKAAHAVAFDWYIGARESENRWSPELEVLYGLEPGSFDRTYRGWKKLVHPDDWPAVKLAIERANQSGDVDAEYRVVLKDGGVRWLQAKGRMFFDAAHVPERMVGFMIDVTDRRQAEEALRASQAYLAEAQRLSHTGSWALDVAAGRYLYTSEESDRIWGFDPHGQKPSRQEVAERIHPEDRAQWRRSIEKSLLQKEDSTDEYRIRLPDGTVRHLRTIRHPILDAAGKVVKVIGTSIDVTERKRAEEERERLRHLEAEMTHANRVITIGELTASIAHEVNQPLGAMVANAGACARWLAADPPEVEKARRALDSIAADGRRASAVVGRIRALTKQQAPRKDRLDINQKIVDVLSITDRELRGNDIAVETRLEETLPRVTGDRVQVQQVLLNIVVNAIDAMRAVSDRPRRLTIVSRPEGADAVIVEVRDSGPGLDPDDGDRLFEAFYTTKPDGMGIGLSISRSIIEAHGGRLWASPNEPHGAIFSFSLPVAEDGA